MPKNRSFLRNLIDCLSVVFPTSCAIVLAVTVATKWGSWDAHPVYTGVLTLVSALICGLPAAAAVAYKKQRDGLQQRVSELEQNSRSVS